MKSDLIQRVPCAMVVATILVWCSIATAAGDDEAPAAPSADVAAQLEQMKQQLNAMQQENQAMRGQIDELHARTEDNWLTEARAEEIRGLVADVLADADTRSSLLQSGLAAGWSEHFFLADPNGRFALFLEGMMQVRWIYSYMERSQSPFAQDRDQHREGFENTRTRLTFRGYVFSPDMEYLIRGDFARGASANEQNVAGGEFDLLDAWIRYRITNDWALRVGQIKLPYNREELVQPSEQLAVERSIINELFNVGRSQGVEVTWSSNSYRLMLATSDGGSGPAGAPGGIRANTPALLVDTEYSVTGRFEQMFSGTWEQFSDFTSPPGDSTGMLFGLGVHAEETESQVPAFTQSTTRTVAGTADLSMEWGGASAFGSASFTYVDSPAQGMFHFTGLMGQVSVYLAPKWEAFLRGEYANFEVGSGGTLALSDVGIVTTGFNYYMEGHDLKWTTDISFGITDVSLAPQFSDIAGFRNNGQDTWPQVVFRTQFQLLF